MKNILVCTDCDFDDTTPIFILLCQHIQRKINILGIVCDDGFLTFYYYNIRCNKNLKILETTQIVL